ncbi:hypothetical protein D3C76_1644360 [compost metagenome]
MPPLWFSSPAIMRSSVVLPEPDGPNNATISPEAISSEISFNTLVRPKDLLIPLISMLMIFLPLETRILTRQAPLQSAFQK